ncbi:MAG: hypothetical protein WBP54_09075, partial [Pelodictyon phaeoclathratiforme]
NLSSAIVATDKDGDYVTVDDGFTITVENDVPIAVKDLYTNDTPWVWLYEGEDTILKTVTTDTGTRTNTLATYNLLANELNFFGADEPVTKTVTSIQYTDVTGSHWVDVGATVTKMTLYGELTVKVNGDVTYKSNMSVPQPANGIRDDIFYYKITDADGDTSTASAGVRIIDRGVGINNPGVVSVLESGLSGGDVASLPVPVDVEFNADPLDLRFNYNNTTRKLYDCPIDGHLGTTTFGKLTSNGNPLNYYLVPDAAGSSVFHTLIAYAGGAVAGLPSVEKRVFTITINNSAPDANPDPTYTFTLHQQVDGVTTAGSPSKLTLNFAQEPGGDGIPGFVVSETLTDPGVSNNQAYSGFTVEVTDDPIPYTAPTTGADPLLYYDGYADVDVHSTQSYDALGGTDTLLLWNEGCIDFAVDRDIANIEYIDLTQKGSHSLWNMSTADVVGMTAESGGLLYILGDSADSVSGSGWTYVADETVGVHTYATYTGGLATLKIETTITQTGVV